MTQPISSPDLLGRMAPAKSAHPLPATSTQGHRGRMRARLLTAGPDALADDEMLEMVLFTALPRRDTKPVARALLQRFDSFAGAIAASVEQLRGIEGLGEAGIAALKTVQAAAIRLAHAEAKRAPALDERTNSPG